MDSERQMSGTPLYKNVIASCALALGTVFCAWAQPQPLDLNGSWEFAFAEGKTLETAGGADFVATDRMSVPGCWDMQPKWLCKRGTGLYRRTFTLAEPVENAWIVVDGMGLRAQFAVDGKPVGGVQPFPWGRLASRLPSRLEHSRSTLARGRPRASSSAARRKRRAARRRG